MKYLFLSLLLFLFFNSSIADSKQFVIFIGYPAGMFCNFQMVLSLCKQYEQEEIQGFTVNFKNRGHYYDKAFGNNWWEYYFEPLNIGSSLSAEVVESRSANPRLIAFYTTREKNNYLINKYIKIKKHIQKKIDTFVKYNFKDDYVIAIHYRGTDKVGEAPRVPYEEVCKIVTTHAEKLQGKPWKIFIATDEKDFIAYMNLKFYGKICYQKCLRSKKDGYPIHIKNPHPYESGENALIDCVLLSKASFLIRTSSNLSLISTFFNPEIENIELNKNLYYHE